MTKAADIANALLGHAAALATGPHGLPLAYPEIATDPPASGKYLEVRLFYNRPTWEAVSAGVLDQGLLQITVVWPKGEGVIKALEAAERVRARYPKNTRLASGSASVAIDREPTVASPISDGSDLRIPVTISWAA